MPAVVPARPSEARERLLATASALFYAEGITSVGVDRIVSAARVTRATFYRHFPGKEDLVVASLEAELAGHHDGDELVRALGREVAREIAAPGYRGCAFINAASEFEDARSPVRAAVAAHRAWYLAAVRRAFARAGHARPGSAARHFLMLRDGAMTAGYLDSPTAAQRTFERGVRGLVDSRALAAASAPDDDVA
jgi:AcrR family transcriptional regulator